MFHPWDKFSYGEGIRFEKINDPSEYTSIIQVQIHKSIYNFIFLARPLQIQPTSCLWPIKARQHITCQ